MNLGECAYCGERRELTRDHVPPRCLFSKPRPGNLITVPSCSSCNAELSKDDQHFHIMITLGIDRVKFPKEFADSIDSINRLNEKARLGYLGFPKILLQNYHSDSGNVGFDRNRVAIFLHRVARGLFYHHNGVRLPESVPFEFCDINESLDRPAIDREQIHHLERNLITIGQGTFRYAYVFGPWPEPDPFGTLWLMRFYDHRTFFCATSSNSRVDQNHSSAAAGGAGDGG